MDKYVILDDLSAEQRYLVGYENGNVGFVTYEFETDSAIDLHSQWKLITVINGTKTLRIVVDVTGDKIVNIEKYASNLGFVFCGAYVPELQMWIYMVDSYKKLTAKS